MKSDLLQYVDNNKTVLSVLVDMSATIDTVDHPILLQRFRDLFGLRESVESWFQSYRTIRVSIKKVLPDEHVLNYIYQK